MGWGRGECDKQQGLSAVLRPGSQHFMALLCDEDGVLVLSRQLSIGSDDCPLVVPHAGALAALCQHGLDGEGHAFHHAGAIGVAPVLHNWKRVEDAAHTMPHKVLNHSKLCSIRYVTYDLPSPIHTHDQRHLQLP